MSAKSLALPQQSLLELGDRVELALDRAGDESYSEIRAATFCGVDEQRLHISQTEPELPAADARLRARLTSIVHGEDGPERQGFEVRFSVIEPLDRADEACAKITLERTGDLEILNVRSAYRLEHPPPDSGIGLHLGDIRYFLFDISLGGARIQQDAGNMLETGQMLAMQASVDDDLHPLEVKVVRAFEATDVKGGKVPCAALQFLNLNSSTLEALAHKIRAIEREMRFRARFGD